MAELKPGWRRVKFGEVVRQVKDKVDPKSSGLKRFVAGEHMDSNDLRIRRWGEIGDGYLGPAFHMRFRPGQVLYGSRRTYLRKLAIADFEGICANTTFVLEPMDSGILLSELLPFIMQTEGFHEHSKRESKGSVNPYVNFSDLAWYEFTLPPQDEQHRLVTVLRRHREIIEAGAETLHQAEIVRRSLLFHWFRRQRGALDSFPKHWRIKSVREVGTTQVGIRKHPGSWAGPNMRPYLRVANVLDGVIDWSDIATINVPQSEQERCALHDGDVLVNKGNSINLVGRSAIFRQVGTERVYFQDHLLRFRASEQIVPEFAQAYFQHLLYTLQFTRIAVASTSIATIPTDLFEALPFPIPPADEQMALVSQSRAREAAITHLRERTHLSGVLAAKILQHIEGAL